MLLRNRVAVITGSASGIGRAGARLFAQEGAKVVIADINDKGGQDVAEAIKKGGGEATYVHTDVSLVKDLENMIKTAVKTYGGLNIFWSNVAAYRQGSIDSITEEMYDNAMATDLKAAVFGSKYAIDEFRKARGGCILFTNSEAGLKPSRVMVTYTLAKAGLTMLTRYLAVYLSKDNIRVNNICPCPVRDQGERTPFATETLKTALKITTATSNEFANSMAGQIPMGRPVTVEELAHAALFLASDQASMITGVSLPVDGGAVAI